MSKQNDTPIEAWPVEVIRSARRRKTVSAKLKDGTIVVRAPDVMSDEELAPIIENFRERFRKRLQPIPRTDEELEQMARTLNKKYFKGKLKWRSIRFVTNQNKRYGSCTPARGDIRISHRVAAMPLWVQRYVVMHELAHLRQANHSPAFWKLVNRYPLTERARGYLIALSLEVDEEAE